MHRRSNQTIARSLCFVLIGLGHDGDDAISYSHKEFVPRLYEGLKRRDREAWVDWQDIRPTEEFIQAIYGAIEGADTFIFVPTPDFVASVPCDNEIAHAMN